MVTGASGLLGGRLASLLSSTVQVVATRHEAAAPVGLASCPLDLLSEASVVSALDLCRPDAVAHAAALADPDLCEREPGRASAVNAGGPRALARLCRRHGIRLVVLSTDLVFGSEGGTPFPEDAPAHPLLVYGRTKREGEEAVLTEDPGAAVVRVALVHGRGHGPRPTASEAVAWAIREGRPSRLFTDQFRTPVDAESVASALMLLLTGRGAGVFHLGGPERLSRYELGVRTARLLGLDASLLQPVRSAESQLGAPRPADVSLDSSRAARELGWSPRPLDAGILEGRPSRPV